MTWTDLPEPYERRSRGGQVLAVTKFSKGRVRLFKGAFAYFSPDDFTPLESLERAGSARDEGDGFEPLMIPSGGG